MSGEVAVKSLRNVPCLVACYDLLVFCDLGDLQCCMSCSGALVVVDVLGYLLEAVSEVLVALFVDPPSFDQDVAEPFVAVGDGEQISSLA